MKLTFSFPKNLVQLNLNKSVVSSQRSAVVQRSSGIPSLPLLLKAMDQNLKTQSVEKPNKCNQCDYASVQAGDLRRHLKMHSGEKSNTGGSRLQ